MQSHTSISLLAGQKRGVLQVTKSCVWDWRQDSVYVSLISFMHHISYSAPNQQLVAAQLYQLPVQNMLATGLGLVGFRVALEGTQVPSSVQPGGMRAVYLLHLSMKNCDLIITPSTFNM